MKNIFGLIFLAGLLTIFGATGALEHTNISFTAAIAWSVLGFVLMAIGAKGAGIWLSNY